MKTFRIKIEYQKYKFEELDAETQKLIEAAKDASETSYAPYSKLNVGAAVLLENGIIIKGSNQENAAYPSGLCAERVALFYANAQYPDTGVSAIAIAAQCDEEFSNYPITPCGSCRQVFLETELRSNGNIAFYLYGEKYIYKIEGAKNLLPLSFGEYLF